MPTYEVEPRFWNDYHRLTVAEQRMFRHAVEEFVGVLREWEQERQRGIPRFPRRLGVTPMVNQPGIMELAWAADGRATWRYGTPRRPQTFHIIWRRIGSHDIYSDP